MTTSSVRGSNRVRAAAWRRFACSLGLTAAGGAMLGGGCGHDLSPGDAGFESGSRLRAMKQDGGDGAEVFVSWWDSKLGVACQFEAASDGSLRCLPIVPSSVPAFADAQCTVPAVVPYADSCSSSPGRYDVALVAPPSGTCSPSTFVVHELGAATNAYAMDGAGHCVLSGGTAYALGAEVPPTAFVGASVEDTPMDSGKLEVRTLHAEDGASIVTALVDAKSGIPCATGLLSYAPTNEYAKRCIPETTAEGVDDGYFADASCTTHAPVAEVGNACGAPAGSIVWFRSPSPGECNDVIDFDVRATGSTVAADAYYRGSPTSCSKSEPGTVVEVGDPIPLDHFVSMPMGEIGSGRLRMGAFVDDGGNALLPANRYGVEFHDTKLDTTCYPMPFADGMRCVPSGIAASSSFRDAACKQPIYVAYPASCDTPPPTPTEVLSCPGECGAVCTAWNVGAAFPPVGVYFSTAEGCLPQTVDPSVTYYSLDGPVDPPSWAPVRTITE